MKPYFLKHLSTRCCAVTIFLLLTFVRRLCCRYFTTPLMMTALHLPPASLRAIVTMGVVFAAVNALSIYMFLCRPYTWVDGSTARFIW